MKNIKLRKAAAFLSAVAVLSSAVSVYADTDSTVKSSQLLGETSFDYKSLPWHTVVSSPAIQNYEIDRRNGAFHILIVESEGADHEKWDLQFRHKNLSFKAGHEYKISFRVKAKREGMELCSKICNSREDEEYCVLYEDRMENGPHMGGQWGKAAVLTGDWQEITGTFKPICDINNAKWSFEYASGTMYEGNAIDGDELWFDDMSLECVTCDECTGEYTTDADLGVVCRRNSGLENNFISVNQLGYLPNGKKTAVLGDNSGEMLPDGRTLNLTEDTYDFDIVNADTDEVVFSGTSGKGFKDADSGDRVYRLDFSDFSVPGRYYIKSGDLRSFEFSISSDIYDTMLTDTVNYFYQNRSGEDIRSEFITSGNTGRLARTGHGARDYAYVQKSWKRKYSSATEASDNSSSRTNVHGGWYESDSNGKFVVNSGLSVWTLQNMYERNSLFSKNSKFADGSGVVCVPETGNDVPDILDEAAQEIDWMSRMIVKEDEPEWGKIAAGMLYSSVQDSKVRPLAEKEPAYDCEPDSIRVVKPPTFAATLNFAACAAQAARLWAPYDSEKAADYLSKAKAAYNAYEMNFYAADVTEVMHPEYNWLCAKEELNKKSLYAPESGNASGTEYGDFDVSDEDYWAACEIFVSAKELGDADADLFFEKLTSRDTFRNKYEKPFEVFTKIHPESDEGGSLTSFDSTNTAAAGTLTLALHRDLLSREQAETIEKSILDAADRYAGKSGDQGYEIPYYFDGPVSMDSASSLDPCIFIDGYEYGSNRMALNNAVIMAYAFDITGAARYHAGVTGAMDYLLGKNPLSYSYISGYGSYTVQNPRHFYWCSELDKDFPSAPDGVAVNGPNVDLVDPYIRGLGFVPLLNSNISQRCYADSVEAWSVNRTGAEINAPLSWVVSFLQDEADFNYTEALKAESQTPENDKNNNQKNPDSSEKITGDLTGDGKVDLTDLSELSLWLIGDKKSVDLSVADVDGDGEVRLTDLAKMRQYLSHVIDAF